MEVPSFSSINFKPNEPLQRQLHAKLMEWICVGRITPGTKLPASRRLALELGISRNTVVEVIDQLRAEGFLTSTVGSGVYVTKELPAGSIESNKVAWSNQGKLPIMSDFAGTLSNKNTALNHGITMPFTPGIPDINAFPIKIWQKVQRQHIGRQSLMGYGDYQGYEPLRIALAEYLSMSRGVLCCKEQIIITTGAQQAISLCAQLLLNKGDEVLMENPGYIGARKAFLGQQARLRPIRITAHGLDVDYLIKNTLRTQNARLMYITPNHQYPMGGILPAVERLKLLDWAVQRNTWLIEDDYDSEFHYTHKPIAALQGMAVETPVIYMGSFSKTLFPALRLGYLVVPKRLVTKFVQAKTFMTGESPLLTQAIVADFIQEGHFVRHVRKMRELYKQKWLHFDALIREHLQGLATPVAESAGMHLVLDIKDIDDNELKAQLAEHGFGSSALSSYYIDASKSTGLVLGFANTKAKERENCIKMLKSLVAQATP